MSTEEKKSKQISRRDFVKSAVVGTAAVAGGTILAGCAPKAAATDAVAPTGTTASNPAGGTQLLTADLVSQKWAFEVPPAPIADSDIANTVTADIIVVGSGTAGLVCATSAVENGAKVVLISASKGNISRGGSNHAMNSKLMKANADKFPIPDTNQFLRKELSVAGYNVDQDKWWKFAKYSEEAMDWLIDKMEAAGYQTVLEAGFSDPDNGPLDMPVGSHAWISADMKKAGMGQQFVVDTLAKNAKEAGAEIIYETVAEQLVRENNNTGRVTAVIAKGKDGKYTKYVGTKGIVLATGDFSKDKDMMAKYCPWPIPLLSDVGDQGYDNTFKIGGLFKGDGQKMGIWVGAAWQRTYPNCPMIGGSVGPSPQLYSGHQGLLVNKNGYRYSNEDANDSFAGLSQIRQPDRKGFAIWSTNYAADSAPWISGSIRGDAPMATADVIKTWEDAVKAKTYVKADTIDGVITALGLPMDATKATIERYNQMCKNGVDEDFFKRKERLIAIETGPFYGAVGNGPAFLTVLGGLRTNLNMQVCDENDQPIPGLFNIGTMVGDFFANMYTFTIEGNNLGANCITFGYLTGRAIAKGEIA
jgi:succinate dehydrogenase/fumarate reductase flavoprotein subunit